MKLLKEQDDHDWALMQAQYNSSEGEENDSDAEDFAWYDPADKDIYFVLSTNHKNMYMPGH